MPVDDDTPETPTRVRPVLPTILGRTIPVNVDSEP
jgi:hypothetical protein